MFWGSIKFIYRYLQIINIIIVALAMIFKFLFVLFGNACFVTILKSKILKINLLRK